MIVPNREGRVAIIVSAREYQALDRARLVLGAHYLSASAPYEGEARDMRCLDTLVLKCTDAGIRTTLTEPKEDERRSASERRAQVIELLEGYAEAIVESGNRASADAWVDRILEARR